MSLKWKQYRFHANENDYRPVKFPPPGPYWCSGFGDGYSIVICYLPAEASLTEFWPEANHVDETEEEKIVYSDRFAKPEWWTGAE